MQSEQVLDIAREALKVAVLLAGPMLAFGLLTGVVVSLFQAVTQISESTIAIIPKMLAILLAFLLFAPWMIDVITSFTVQLFESIPQAVR